MNFVRVTKLNFTGVLKNPLMKSMFGGIVDLESVPPQEVVILNLDRVIGISEVLKSGVLEDSDEPKECVKVYFGKNDYWAIAVDKNYESLKKHIGM